MVSLETTGLVESPEEEANLVEPLLFQAGCTAGGWPDDFAIEKTRKLRFVIAVLNVRTYLDKTYIIYIYKLTYHLSLIVASSSQASC